MIPLTKIGEVMDVLVDHEGRIAALIVGAGCNRDHGHSSYREIKRASVDEQAAAPPFWALLY
jgi:hypothetical protein